MIEPASLPIVGVVVHRDGALVERRGSRPVVDGRIEIRRLPLLLDESSLRAEVQGARLDDLRLSWDLEGVDRAAAPAVVDELVRRRGQLGVLQAELQALVEQRDQLTEVGPSTEGEHPPPPDRVAAWARLGEILEPWMAELDERIAALQREFERETEQIGLLEHELSAHSSEAFWRRWAPMRVATLAVREASPTAEVTLSYRMPGATWTPAYVLDADGLFKRGRFTMRALVTQATGEDWRGVALALSTSPSTRRVELPELPALRLGAAQPPSPSPWRPLPGDLDDLFPPDLPGMAPEMDAMSGAPPRPPQSKRKMAKGRPPPQPAPAPAAEAAMDEPVRTYAMPASAAPRGGGLMRAMSAALPSIEAAPQAAGAPAPQAAGAPAPPPPPQVQPSHLDYPSLRLRGWTAGPSERGRLRPQLAGDELLEAGLPYTATERLASRTAVARRNAAEVAAKPLPPHHVVPGPLEDAHFRFDAEAAVDVPSDGRFHNVAVFSEPVELSVRYRAVPRLDPRAFRMVSAALERSAPLLPGPVDVHVDGTLEMTTPWKGTPGRGGLELDLGVEDGIKVARNVRYREESAGMFGGSRRLFTTVEVQVASTLPRETRVELLDRVPVPAGDDVSVEVTASDPQATEFAGERDGPLLKGGRRQVVQVPPGGERTATLTYAVTLGAKDELVGGDRRG